MSETTAEYSVSNDDDVLQSIKDAREIGDFDSVKRLSKKELENPQSNINPLLIMDEIAHMFLDIFLIWVNEMEKKDPTVNMNKHVNLRLIAGHLEDPNTRVDYTQYIREMIEADAEEVINNFLSVNDNVEKAREVMKDGRGIL